MDGGFYEIGGDPNNGGDDLEMGGWYPYMVYAISIQPKTFMLQFFIFSSEPFPKHCWLNLKISDGFTKNRVVLPYMYL